MRDRAQKHFTAFLDALAIDDVEAMAAALRELDAMGLRVVLAPDSRLLLSDGCLGDPSPAIAVQGQPFPAQPTLDAKRSTCQRRGHRLVKQEVR